jgi:hypothetical protein
MIELYMYPPPVSIKALSHQNIISISTAALPKGIKRPTLALNTHPHIILGSRMIELYNYPPPVSI